MKKIYSSIMAVALFASALSCTSGNNNNTNNAGTQTAQTARLLAPSPARKKCCGVASVTLPALNCGQSAQMLQKTGFLAASSCPPARVRCIFTNKSSMGGLNNCWPSDLSSSRTCALMVWTAMSSRVSLTEGSRSSAVGTAYRWRLDSGQIESWQKRLEGPGP